MLPYYNTVEQDDGELLVHGFNLCSSVDWVEPPKEFWSKSIRWTIKWSDEHFPSRAQVVLLNDGTLAFLRKVGQNASHDFYIGQSQDGQLFRATRGEETAEFHELLAHETCEYLGKGRFSVKRMYIRPISDSSVNNLYWGHA